MTRRYYLRTDRNELHRRYRREWAQLVAVIRALSTRLCEFCHGPIEIRGGTYKRKRTTRFCSQQCSRWSWEERRERGLTSSRLVHISVAVNEALECIRKNGAA